jgi:hypothetical protein
MAGIGKALELLQVPDHPGPERIQMDVADQLQQIGVFLTGNGPVAVLEEIAVSPVSAVEAHHIAGEEPRHHGRDGNTPCSQEKMNVVRE